MIKIKQCCHSSTQKYRFNAEIGDRVLIRCDDGNYIEATIQFISPDDNVTVTLMNGKKIKIPAEKISVLMLND